MTIFRMRDGLILVLAATMLAACSGPPSPTPEQQAAAQKKADNAAADKKLVMFHKLVKMGQLELAASIGDELVAKYPDSDAAKKVADKLPDIKAKAKADKEKTRLANLWLYQVSPMAGGMQSTATISNSKPQDIKVRLILRRHTEWGTSAYLYASDEKGFVCHGECPVAVTFDGKKHVFHAVTPDDGRPALMFRHQKDFIKRLQKADKVVIPVTVQGKGKQDLVFETGGFVPDKWKPLDAR